MIHGFCCNYWGENHLNTEVYHCTVSPETWVFLWIHTICVLLVSGIWKYFFSWTVHMEKYPIHQGYNGPCCPGRNRTCCASLYFPASSGSTREFSSWNKSWQTGISALLLNHDKATHPHSPFPKHSTLPSVQTGEGSTSTNIPNITAQLEPSRGLHHRTLL